MIQMQNQLAFLSIAAQPPEMIIEALNESQMKSSRSNTNEASITTPVF